MAARVNCLTYRNCDNFMLSVPPRNVRKGAVWFAGGHGSSQGAVCCLSRFGGRSTSLAQAWGCQVRLPRPLPTSVPPPSHPPLPFSFPSDLLPHSFRLSVAALLNETPKCNTAIPVEAFIDWLGSHVLHAYWSGARPICQSSCRCVLFLVVLSTSGRLVLPVFLLGGCHEASLHAKSLTKMTVVLHAVGSNWSSKHFCKLKMPEGLSVLYIDNWMRHKQATVTEHERNASDYASFLAQHGKNMPADSAVRYFLSKHVTHALALVCLCVNHPTNLVLLLYQRPSEVLPQSTIKQPTSSIPVAGFTVLSKMGSKEPRKRALGPSFIAKAVDNLLAVLLQGSHGSLPGKSELRGRQLQVDAVWG